MVRLIQKNMHFLTKWPKMDKFFINFWFINPPSKILRKFLLVANAFKNILVSILNIESILNFGDFFCKIWTFSAVGSSYFFLNFWYIKPTQFFKKYFLLVANGFTNILISKFWKLNKNWILGIFFFVKFGFFSRRINRQ